MASSTDLGKFDMLQITEVATSRRPTKIDDHIHIYPGVSNYSNYPHMVPMKPARTDVGFDFDVSSNNKYNIYVLLAPNM